MVHQLSLFDSIDDDSYNLFISTLTTLSGNPPVLYANISRIWKPNEAFDIDRVNSKNQLVELNRMKLSKEIPLSLFQDSEEPSELSFTLLRKLAHKDVPIEPNLMDALLSDSKGPGPENDSKMELDADSKRNRGSSSWALTMSDIPAAGSNRKVSTQTISESVILSTAGENSSLTTFLKELGYVESYQYVTAGVRFYMRNDLVIVVHKIWNVGSEKKVQITKGGFLVKAYVNVNRGTDIERINQAETTLLALQKELQGYVDLTIPDRKTMDSRLDYANGNI